MNLPKVRANTAKDKVSRLRHGGPAPNAHQTADQQRPVQQNHPAVPRLVDTNILRSRLDCMEDTSGRSRSLGDILVQAGAVTREEVERAVAYQAETGRRLGEALISLNCLSEEIMRQALCSQLNIPFVDLDGMQLDTRLARLINRKYAQNRRIVPVTKMGTTLTLAMDDPTDTQVVKELYAFIGLSIQVVTSTRAAILHAFARLYDEYRVDEQVHKEVEIIEEEEPDTEASEYLNSQQLRKANVLVSQLINTGMKYGASDIHLETTDQHLYARFRIDGVLQKLRLGRMEEELNRLKREVVSRIKILGNLNIAEKRRPQDGSFRALVGFEGNRIHADFRISVVPGYYGENVVIRILDSSMAPKSIDGLGFSSKINRSLHRLLKRNTGIILVTGPTGSGKSTTLYGALMTAYRPGIKILTAEDPIEYVYDKITQCQVNPAIGNTFANYIRAFLRQDPEVILVGEIRDSETAEMAFRAAQTGHLVLSTLHTNDAVGTVPRLLGLGVDPGLIGSCLIGVLAQRLIRQVCPRCKQAYNPPEELIREFFPVSPPDVRWVAGRKCAHCNHTGYRGRLAVAELWTPESREFMLINKGANVDKIRESAYTNPGTVSMAEDALVKLQEEKTNLEELARTLPFSSIHQFRQF